MPVDSILSLSLGLGLGAGLFWLGFHLKKGGFETIGQTILLQAQNEAKDKILKAELEIQERSLRTQKDLEVFLQKEKSSLSAQAESLKEKERSLDSLFKSLEKKQASLEKLEEKFSQVQVKELYLEGEIQKLAGMTKVEAQAALEASLGDKARQFAAKSAARILKEAQEEGEKKAKRILATAIGRLASQAVSEHTVTSVPLQNKEVKGKIIGREGRNIRHLEHLTGVTFIIDDTPGEVLLSSFNPVRRHVAKTALLDLIAGDRIHPTRIEEAVHNAEKKTDALIIERGEEAAERAGVMGLHEELIKLLGKLSFRTSYGQNILEHSLEVSRLMGLMAAELGVNRKLAERIGLLHDMGKALTHEVPGTHAIIGYDYALKYGESPEVANGIGCHHSEMEPLSVEASLCQAADTLSAARPGARIDAVENYLSRIKSLEELAYEFPGVEKSYALQSGKEIRVVVLPDMIDDLGMVHLAQDLTKKIEARLDYPGKIKVTVIRERRAVEYAI